MLNWFVWLFQTHFSRICRRVSREVPLLVETEYFRPKSNIGWLPTLLEWSPKVAGEREQSTLNCTIIGTNAFFFYFIREMRVYISYKKRIKKIQYNIQIYKNYFSRPISPNRTKVTTTEKFVSTGPTGTPSGIPGLELLDAELQNVSFPIKITLLKYIKLHR